MQDNPPKEERRLVPRKGLARRQGVSPRTVARRERDDPQFPKPVKINGRNYFWDDEILAYERTLARAGFAGP